MFSYKHNNTIKKKKKIYIYIYIYIYIFSGVNSIRNDIYNYSVVVKRFLIEGVCKVLSKLR